MGSALTCFAEIRPGSLREHSTPLPYLEVLVVTGPSKQAVIPMRLNALKSSSGQMVCLTPTATRNCDWDPVGDTALPVPSKS